MAENSWFDWRQAVVAVIRDDFSDVLEEVAENYVDWEARRRFMRRAFAALQPNVLPAIRHRNSESLCIACSETATAFRCGELRHSYGVGNVGR